MRALLMLVLIPFVAACATAAPATPSASIGEPGAIDVSGRWTGTWIGTGIFHSPREDDVAVDLAQRGSDGAGRLVFDGAVAAESVPWEVRRQGLAGIRIRATIDGPRVTLKHEVSGRLFTAMLDVKGDYMIGDVVGGAPPGVRLILTRRSDTVPQTAQAAPPEPAPVESAEAEEMEPPTLLALAPSSQVEEPVQPEPAQPQEPEGAQRPRMEEFVSVPELRAVYFAYDKSALSAEATDVLTTNLAWLHEHDDTLVMIEGYCDERGTSEYNLALGERRAKSVLEHLAEAGIARDRISTISYGKERPVCTEGTEDCMKRNRRAEFRVKSR